MKVLLSLDWTYRGANYCIQNWFKSRQRRSFSQVFLARRNCQLATWSANKELWVCGASGHEGCVPQLTRMFRYRLDKFQLRILELDREILSTCGNFPGFGWGRLPHACHVRVSHGKVVLLAQFGGPPFSMLLLLHSIPESIAVYSALFYSLHNGQKRLALVLRDIHNVCTGVK